MGTKHWGGLYAKWEDISQFPLEKKITQIKKYFEAGYGQRACHDAKETLKLGIHPEVIGIYKQATGMDYTTQMPKTEYRAKVDLYKREQDKQVLLEIMQGRPYDPAALVLAVTSNDKEINSIANHWIKNLAYDNSIGEICEIVIETNNFELARKIKEKMIQSETFYVLLLLARMYEFLEEEEKMFLCMSMYDDCGGNFNKDYLPFLSECKKRGNTEDIKPHLWLVIPEVDNLQATDDWISIAEIFSRVIEYSGNRFSAKLNTILKEFGGIDLQLMSKRKIRTTSLGKVILSDEEEDAWNNWMSTLIRSIKNGNIIFNYKIFKKIFSIYPYSLKIFELGILLQDRLKNSDEKELAENVLSILETIIEGGITKENSTSYLMIVCLNLKCPNKIRMAIIEKILLMNNAHVILEVAEHMILKAHSHRFVPRMLIWYRSFTIERKLYFDDKRYESIIVSLYRKYRISFKEKDCYIDTEEINSIIHSVKVIEKWRAMSDDKKIADETLKLIKQKKVNKKILLEGINAAMKSGTSEKVVIIYGSIAVQFPDQAMKLTKVVAPYFVKYNKMYPTRKGYKVNTSNIWGNTVLEFPVNRLAKVVSGK